MLDDVCRSLNELKQQRAADLMHQERSAQRVSLSTRLHDRHLVKLIVYDDVCRSLNELKQQREAELEARGEPSDAVSFSDFPEQSSAFIVHHTSILRNKRLLLIYT